MNLQFMLFILINGLSQGMVLFIIASGLSLVFGVLRVINFAHGSLYMIGAFMAFSLIYTSCVATIAAIRRETNSWAWTAFAVSYQFALAWLVAFVIYQGGRLLGFH